MSNAKLGKWRNPPLVYVLAELGISPYYSIGHAMPGLQDRLRAVYPRTLEAQELVVEGNNPPVPVPLWRLISADQKSGVQIGTRAISLHVTGYQDSGTFLGLWAKILSAVGDEKLNPFVERAGLRYIDLIVPSDAQTPANFLAPSLQGISPDGAATTGAMWAAGFRFESGVVSLRTAAPAPIGMLLPPNFDPLPLDKPVVLSHAEQRLKNKQPIGFIDTDCVTQVQKVFNVSELTNTYMEMQKSTSRTFKSALSDVALEAWK